MSKKIPKRYRERARQLFNEIRRQFPSCQDPWPIIAFALNNKNSVVFDGTVPVAEQAELIVKGRVRHVDTNYEKLLSQGIEREEARRAICREQNKKLCELRAAKEDDGLYMRDPKTTLDSFRS
ncbi:MAG TPA: DUF2293 domain-containing protein [Candidatus Paceibacterota bacterium]|nr:DUF2293 domain-containing protein [Candidatus Paceibacterota bacterium]